MVFQESCQHLHITVVYFKVKMHIGHFCLEQAIVFILRVTEPCLCPYNTSILRKQKIISVNRRISRMQYVEKIYNFKIFISKQISNNIYSILGYVELGSIKVYVPSQNFESINIFLKSATVNFKSLIWIYLVKIRLIFMHRMYKILQNNTSEIKTL